MDTGEIELDRDGEGETWPMDGDPEDGAEQTLTVGESNSSGNESGQDGEEMSDGELGSGQDEETSDGDVEELGSGQDGEEMSDGDSEELGSGQDGEETSDGDVEERRAMVIPRSLSQMKAQMMSKLFVGHIHELHFVIEDDNTSPY